MVNKANSLRVRVKQCEISKRGKQKTFNRSLRNSEGKRESKILTTRKNNSMKDKFHKVNLTNEEFHYISELLANRLVSVTNALLFDAEKTLKYDKEANLITSLISEKFISI